MARCLTYTDRPLRGPLRKANANELGVGGLAGFAAR